MESVLSPSYWLTRFCFQRALGFVYLIAFLVTAHQFRGLIGEHGLLPAPLYLKHVRFWESPSLFFLDSSDRFLTLFAWLGVLLSVVAMSGFSERFGIYFSAAVWFLLWVFYLSFVNVGQTFYGFGWETMLLETGFIAIFLGSNDTRPPTFLIWFLRWELFRLMFGAGLIKIRGDECWRNLTCMFYHYETQPIPNPLSWYLHRLPPIIHKAGTLFTHFVELVVPFAYLAKPLCALAGILTILFQLMLIFSGNLSWLNYLTIVISLSCFDDSFLSKFIPMTAPETAPVAGVRQAMMVALSALLLALSVRPAMNLVSRNQMMNASFDPLHLVNTYGAFGSITKERMEIVFEGTGEWVILPSTKWREYEFKAKPGSLHRGPPIVAPYHLRLDWLLWFAAMGHWRHYPWILNLTAKLLENDTQILKLIDKNPFPETPPRFVRAKLYRYRFTNFEEKKQTGDWWAREPAEEYLPPLSLNNTEFRKLLRNLEWG